ncbi:protein of unknown function [Pseudodesulfovibrio profundus]|uniref:Uncharacterized protein n=1 Tax=Pseudodesulfovibrio profundus TaxID=57320 RepID=A0A2C8FD52_9BACT|nr:protein of unknown function [Pseudodesulfovibrio profundus]
MAGSGAAYRVLAALSSSLGVTAQAAGRSVRVPCPVEAGRLFGIIIGVTLATCDEFPQRLVGFLVVTVPAGHPYGVEPMRKGDLVDPGIQHFVAFYSVQNDFVGDFVCRGRRNGQNGDNSPCHEEQNRAKHRSSKPKYGRGCTR